MQTFVIRLPNGSVGLTTIPDGDSETTERRKAKTLREVREIWLAEHPDFDTSKSEPGEIFPADASLWDEPRSRRDKMKLNPSGLVTFE